MQTNTLEFAIPFPSRLRGEPKADELKPFVGRNVRQLISKHELLALFKTLQTYDNQTFYEWPAS